MFYPYLLSSDKGNIYQLYICHKSFLYLRSETKNINQIINKIFIETLLNISILPFKNLVVKLTLVLYLIATDLILLEYFFDEIN